MSKQAERFNRDQKAKKLRDIKDQLDNEEMDDAVFKQWHDAVVEFDNTIDYEDRI